jgi:hypothetical protein
LQRAYLRDPPCCRPVGGRAGPAARSVPNRRADPAPGPWPHEGAAAGLVGSPDPAGWANDAGGGHPATTYTSPRARRPGER